MAIITIERNVTFDDLDDHYRMLREFEEVGSQIDLQVPRNLTNAYPGLGVALIQFVISWIRYPKESKLRLDISSPETENWDEIFQQEHIYPIVALAVIDKGVFDITGNIQLDDYFRLSFSRVRDAMVKVHPLKGGKLSLTAIDHFPESVGLLPCFETPGHYIDNESTIGRNIRPAIGYFLNYSHHIKKEYDFVESNLIAIINELMKNTFQWGKTDRSNVPVDPSVRGLLVKFYRRVRSKAVEEFRWHTGLREYFSNQRLQENSIQELYFLEVSVYDSGIGYVERYHEHGFQANGDVEIIKFCLAEHRTSSIGLEKDDKGVGLDRMLKILDHRGFIRIKTNRSCIYRNLITHPYKQISMEKDIELFDWATHSSSKFKSLPEVSGAAITIIYPLAIND